MFLYSNSGIVIDIGHVLQVFSLQLAMEGKKVNAVNKLE